MFEKCKSFKIFNDNFEPTSSCFIKRCLPSSIVQVENLPISCIKAASFKWASLEKPPNSIVFKCSLTSSEASLYKFCTCFTVSIEWWNKSRWWWEFAGTCFNSFTIGKISSKIHVLFMFSSAICAYSPLKSFISS